MTETGELIVSGINELQPLIVDDFLNTDIYDFLPPNKETNEKLLQKCEKLMVLLQRENKIFNISGVTLESVKVLGRFQDLSLNFNSRDIVAKFYLKRNPNFHGNNVNSKDYPEQIMLWWKEYVETTGIFIRRSITIDSEAGQLLTLNDIDPNNPQIQVREENLQILHQKLGFLVSNNPHEKSKELRIFFSKFLCDAIDLIQQDLDGIVDFDQETYVDPYGLKLGLKKTEVPNLLGIHKIQFVTQKTYPIPTGYVSHADEQQNQQNSDPYYRKERRYNGSPKEENYKNGNGGGYHKSGNGGGYYKNGNGGGYYKNGKKGGYQKNENESYQKKENGSYKKSKRENPQSRHTLASQKYSSKTSKKTSPPFATFDPKYVKKNIKKKTATASVYRNNNPTEDGVADDLERMKLTFEEKSKNSGKGNKKTFSKRNEKSNEEIFDKKSANTNFTFNSDYKNLEMNRKMSHENSIRNSSYKKKKRTNSKNERKRNKKPLKMKKKSSSSSQSSRSTSAQRSQKQKKSFDSTRSTSSQSPHDQKKKSDSSRSTSSQHSQKQKNEAKRETSC